MKDERCVWERWKSGGKSGKSGRCVGDGMGCKVEVIVVKVDDGSCGVGDGVCREDGNSEPLRGRKEDIETKTKKPQQKHERGQREKGRLLIIFSIKGLVIGPNLSPTSGRFFSFAALHACIMYRGQEGQGQTLRKRQAGRQAGE
jgi:hypothetical protein